MEAEDIEKIIIAAVREAVKEELKSSPACMCNLGPNAQRELGHFMGMVKDVGNGDHSRGVEVLRDNHRMLTRLRAKVDRMSQGIAWLIIASGVGGVLWLVSEGCKAAIKSIKGP